MSSTNNAFPSSCGIEGGAWLRNAYGKNNVWYIVKKEDLIDKCLNDLKTSVDTQKSNEVQQGQVLIGGLSGAGGLACGLGLFPCLVKLVSKFKG